MHLLQDRLDVAARSHPGRPTLSDFRANDAIVDAEREAFAAAERIVTPHAELAALFRSRAVHLEWSKPAVAVARNPIPDRVAFPGPTVARKGAFEVREAARALGLEVLLLGSELEGSDFWSGVRTVRRAPDDQPYAWLASSVAVVQPALFEERPRHLLAALAAGVPAIATAGCGLAPQPGLTVIRAGDPGAVTAALRIATAPQQLQESQLACAY
jgi:glycosyltransferase involved in cell wall biosynthesis